MSLADAMAVADAVLYEGYLLYPYRATSAKNQVRWQFGIVGPPGSASAGVGEDSTMCTECLLETAGRDAVCVDVHARFLQVQLRAVERAVPGGFQPVDQLDVGSATWIRWHEAVERTVSREAISVAPADFPAPSTSHVIDIPGGEDVELLRDESGRVVGRLVRRRSPLRGELRIDCHPAGPDGLTIIRVELVNDTAWTPDPTGPDSARDVAARSSFVGSHLLLATDGGRFLSLTDPPPAAAEAAARCENHRCWPVLVGPPASHDVVLASPIILADHPEVAPESPGQLFDSTEIDEILTLRIITLTDDEKRAARGTDPRAAAIIDRSDLLPPEVFERLHGALRGLDLGDLDLGEVTDLDPVFAATNRARVPVDGTGIDDVPTYGSAPWWNPAVDASVSPETDTVTIGGVPVRSGSRVRLHPSGAADAQDLFIDGLTAVVVGVYFDVDGDTHVAVVVEDDPAAEIHEWYGRYSYFRPEELEPLVEPAPSEAAS